MSDQTALVEAADRVEGWLANAFPFWLARGVDPHTGLFHEALDHAGVPDRSANLRVRVQGRQLFCVARALAWGHGSWDAAARSLSAVTAACWNRADTPGWIHLLSPEGQPLDLLRDSYDQAFLLFGLAALHEVAPESARAGIRDLAEAGFRFIDTMLTVPEDGGVREGLPDSLPRRSNPHMHLLEAALAWHACTGASAFLQRADRWALLLRDRFLDRDTGTLGEFFTADLRRAPGAAGEVVEPGHHLEWCWLLHQLAEAGGVDLRAEARELHRWAVSHGIDRRSGFAVDECDRTGRHARATRRLWPQTELIKSHLAVGEAPDAGRVAAALLDNYLATTPEGLWIDRFDADGRPAAADVPASSFYHLLVAFEDLLRVAGRRRR